MLPETRKTSFLIDTWVLLSVVFVGFLAVTATTLGILWWLDIPMMALETIGKAFEENLDGIKLIQVANAIGLFILPALLFAFWKAPSQPMKFLGFRAEHSSNSWIYGGLLATLIVFTFFPFNAWIMQLNMQMELPASLEWLEIWMRESEDQLAAMTEVFLTMNTPIDLIVNLLVIAVLPAVSEELFFRGTLQRIFRHWWGNPHVSIWVAAIIFSAIHFQFYGFLPRMLLGAGFGYLLYWSGNIWFPILGHFINNGSMVLAVYFGAMDMDEAVNSPDAVPIWMALISLFITGSLFVTYRKLFREPDLLAEG